MIISVSQILVQEFLSKRLHILLKFWDFFFSLIVFSRIVQIYIPPRTGGVNIISHMKWPFRYLLCISYIYLLSILLFVCQVLCYCFNYLYYNSFSDVNNSCLFVLQLHLPVHPFIFKPFLPFLYECLFKIEKARFLFFVKF